MLELLKIGKTPNSPIEEYYADSEEDLKNINPNAPTGSTVMILTSEGLKVKMKNSKNEWVAI